MSNEQKPHENQSKTLESVAQGTTLTEQELGTVSAGDAAPRTIPLCGLKPNTRAKTQSFVDDVLANGGQVHSFDLDTGKVNFTLGPGTPLEGPM